MSVLSLDTETTLYKALKEGETRNLKTTNANYADSRNTLVCFSYANESTCAAQRWPDGRQHLLDVLSGATLIVGFNFKFDCHWLEKDGISLSKKTLWDVQIAEFILSNQTRRFPSLNETCEKYGIPQKLDVVKTEYWEKGIDTDEIPWPILSEYAAHDADVTLQCYYAQRKLMTPKQVRLCQLMCQDLYILREMEANGLPFDEEMCKEKSVEVDDQISKIKEKLTSIYCNVPLNFSSGDHLSAFLYGGVVKEDGKEFIGYYKTGAKAGQPKYRNVVIEHVLPRLYTPLKGTELQKEGFYETNESTLKKLKGKKETVNLLLELAKLEKRNGTYYKGLVKLREEMNWPEGFLHGQFNQTVAATGRLSSSKPY